MVLNEFILLNLARMKFINQLKAYSMLCIMLFVMMHNAFPHVHHEHKLAEEPALSGEFHHHHHDSGHHHHSGEHQNNHDQKSLFDFLLNDHWHTQHTHQHTPAVVEHAKSAKQLDFKAFNGSANQGFAANEAAMGLHQYVLFKPVKPDDPYLDSHPLRGPPSLT